MPNNKNLDGIKQLSEQDLKKARDVVLQSIGEKSKTAKPVEGISQDEARKIEAATEKFKPKQVDGLVGKQPTADSRRQMAGNKRQTVESGSVLASVEVDQKRFEKENEEQLKLNRQRIKEKETEDKKQRLEKIKQEKHKNTKTMKHKNPPSLKLRRASAKTQKYLPQLGKAGENTKTRKRTRIWLGERGVDAWPRLLITCYLLLVLTLIIIVGAVGFFTIWYNLNNYAVLAKAGKVKQMMESGANFYQIAKSHGDDFGVGKYYTYNEAAVKFGQNIVNLGIGQINIIKHADSGYYIIQCYGRREKLIGLKYIFIKDRSMDDYIKEITAGFRLYK